MSKKTKAESKSPVAASEPKHGAPLIGVLGYAQVGKDTFGDAIASLGFERAAFADELKTDLASLLAEFGCDLTDSAHKARARDLMVEYGKLARSFEPDYWISRLWLPSGAAVITDVRHVNEALAIHEWGGKLVYVSRPGHGPANPVEKQSIHEILLADKCGRFGPAGKGIAKIANDGSLDAFRERARHAATDLYPELSPDASATPDVVTPDPTPISEVEVESGSEPVAA